MATIAYTLILVLFGVLFLVVAFLDAPIPEAAKQILIALGTTLVSTATISMFYEVLTRKSSQKALALLLNESLRDGLNLYGAAAREGISGIFPNRAACGLNAKIANAKRLVIIQNYEATLSELVPSIEKMLKMGGTVEFFYTDPYSDFAHSRQRQLDGKLDSFKNMIVDNLTLLSHLHTQAGARITIREYRDISPIQVFIVDDEIYFAVFWAGEFARNSVNFLVSDQNSPSHQRLRAHYKYYLENSLEIVDPRKRLEDIRNGSLKKALASQ